MFTESLIKSQAEREREKVIVDKQLPSYEMLHKSLQEQLDANALAVVMGRKKVLELQNEKKFTDDLNKVRRNSFYV